MGKSLTKKENDELKKLIDSGKTYNEICEFFGKSRGVIEQRVRRLNYKKPNREIFDVEKKCLNCDKVFVSNKNHNRKFCSQTCSVTFNNKKRKHTEETRVKIGNSLRKDKSKNITSLEEKFCKNCDKSIEKYGNKFCDIKCFHEYEFTKKTLSKFYSGQLNSNKTIRHVLIELYGEKCMAESCPVTGNWLDKPITLHVDHIDGNSDNNEPENLRLLCPNCHTQTETYCGLNNKKKNTRRNRYLRKYKGYEI